MIKAHMANRLKLFNIQSFKWFVLSGIFATFGNGLIYVTLSWMLLKESTSIGSQAILMTCLWAPTILLGPWLGVVADRYHRQGLTILSNLVRGFFIILYCVLSYKGYHASLYMLAAGLGLFVSIYGPAATVLIREIVPEESLLNANATIDVIYEFGSVFGMAASGLFITLFSVDTTLITGGICFVSASLCGYLMQYIPHSFHDNLHQVKKSFKDDFINSINYVKSNTALFNGYCVQMLIMVILMTLPAMLAPFVKQVLNADVTEFGYLEALFSCGVVLGGLLSPFLVEIFGFRKILFGNLSILVAALLLFSFSKDLHFSYILYMLIGVTISSWALILTKTQELTDITFQGRLFSTFNGAGGILTLAIFISLMFIGNNVPAGIGYWIETLFATVALIIFYNMKIPEEKALAIEAS